MDSTLIHTKLHNIRTLTLEWGEAGGLFLSIESLKGIADRIEKSIKADKSFKNKRDVRAGKLHDKFLDRVHP